MESNGHKLSLEERQMLIDSIPTVSFIDSCKENIQPRKSGRSVASLTTIFDTSPSEREHAIAIGHKKFGEQLDTLDEQDDPLDIYIQYINWIHDMYPQGQNSESNIVAILKDATKQFETDIRYKSDPRYLKIWIELSTYVNEPKDIFLFLIRKGIGQTLTLFYEEYAGYYEKLNKIKEALEVYDVGIEIKAEPIKRLHKSLSLFKSRILERRQRGLLRREQQEAETQINELNQSGRTMLGHKFDSRSRYSVPANVYSGIEASSSSSSSNTLSRSRTFGSESSITTTAMTSPSSSFSVYVEPTPASRSTSPATNTFPRTSSSSHSSSSNLHISSASHQRIENQRPIEKFSGAILPQAEIAQDRSFESFQVYQDKSTPTTTSHRTIERSDSMLSISNGEESPIARIKRNPTSDSPPVASKRLRQDINVAEIEKNEKELQNRFNLKKHLYLRSKNSKGGTEYITMLRTIDKETSIEEYRVRKQGLTTVSAVSAENNGWSDYKKEVAKEKMSRVPDLTTETIAAMKSVAKLFDEPYAYNQEEEEDLTWHNPIQKFPSTYHSPSNENDE